MSDAADEMFKLMNPVPEVVAKVFPGAKCVPLTAAELKELSKPKPKK